MKHANKIRYLVILLLVLCAFASCHGFHRSAHVLQRQLHHQQQRSELLTQQLSAAIRTTNVDSLLPTFYDKVLSKTEISKRDAICVTHNNNQLIKVPIYCLLCATFYDLMFI